MVQTHEEFIRLPELTVEEYRQLANKLCKEIEATNKATRRHLENTQKYIDKWCKFMRIGAAIAAISGSGLAVMDYLQDRNISDP